MTHRIFNIISFLLLFGFIAPSCKTAAREEKYYEKQEKKLAAQEQKSYEEKVKAHKELQSKETLKMMRATEKQSKKLNKSRRR